MARSTIQDNLKLTGHQARDLLEIVEDRYDAGSLVITSQVASSEYAIWA